MVPLARHHVHRKCKAFHASMCTAGMKWWCMQYTGGHIVSLIFDVKKSETVWSKEKRRRFQCTVLCIFFFTSKMYNLRSIAFPLHLRCIGTRFKGTDKRSVQALRFRCIGRVWDLLRFSAPFHSCGTHRCTPHRSESWYASKMRKGQSKGIKWCGGNEPI